MAPPPLVLKAYVARSTFLTWCILGISVTAFVTALRTFVRITRQRRLYADDYAMFVGVGFYFALCGCYIGDLPYLYAFYDYTSDPYQGVPPTLPRNYAHMMKYNFAVTSLFWAVLWMVKASLLLFFRRVIKLTDWMRVWWCIAAFTALTFIGCIVTMFTSCDAISDFMLLGQCISRREQTAQIISLYFSFTADVMTDIAIMALPIRVVVGLKVSRRDKLTLVCLFSTGIIAIVFSMIRAFLVYAKTGSTTPSPAWLGLWAVIECMVAIILGCIPAIAQLFRSHRSFTQDRSNSRVYSSNKYYVGDSGIHAGTTGDSRSRVSHITSPIQQTTTSEEDLFEGIRSETEIKVYSEKMPSEIELTDLPIQHPEP